MGDSFGGKQIYVYVWLSLFALHLKPPLISYTPIQNAFGVKILN